MICRSAQLEDIPAWLEQVEEVKDHFPGYDREEYEVALRERITKGEAFLAECTDQMAGVILFSKEEQEVLFLAVFKKYRKQGIGRILIERVLQTFSEGTEVSVITYREGDPLGEVARAFYTALGFEEKELLDVFDYPCQRFSIRVS